MNGLDNTYLGLKTALTTLSTENAIFQCSAVTFHFCRFRFFVNFYKPKQCDRLSAYVYYIASYVEHLRNRCVCVCASSIVEYIYICVNRMACMLASHSKARNAMHFTFIDSKTQVRNAGKKGLKCDEASEQNKKKMFGIQWSKMKRFDWFSVWCALNATKLQVHHHHRRQHSTSPAPSCCCCCFFFQSPIGVLGSMCSVYNNAIDTMFPTSQFDDGIFFFVLSVFRIVP